MKLIGNSGYGSLIMDKEWQRDTLYTEGRGAAQLNINDPRFKKCNVITDNLYEMEMAKTKIRFDLPIQLGYHILQLAKLWMIQFRYDCLEEYCYVNDFEYLEMDTDSAYLSLAGKQFEDIVKPNKKQSLHYETMGQCRDFEYTSEDGFFPRECCKRHKAYDKRTPGLFKVEAEGKAMIALCSKTYILKSMTMKWNSVPKDSTKPSWKNPFPLSDMYCKLVRQNRPPTKDSEPGITPSTPTNRAKEDYLTFTVNVKWWMMAFTPNLSISPWHLGFHETWK